MTVDSDLLKVIFTKEELDIIENEMEIELLKGHQSLHECQKHTTNCPYDHYYNQTIAADMQSILAKVREARGS